MTILPFKSFSPPFFSATYFERQKYPSSLAWPFWTFKGLPCKKVLCSPLFGAVASFNRISDKIQTYRMNVWLRNHLALLFICYQMVMTRSKSGLWLPTWRTPMAPNGSADFVESSSTITGNWLHTQLPLTMDSSKATHIIWQPKKPSTSSHEIHTFSYKALVFLKILFLSLLKRYL